MRHTKDFRTLAHFEYVVDKRGNRTQALEALANPTTATNTTIASTDKGLLLTGSWSDVSSYKESTQTSARLKLLFFGDQATLSMGQGPDHGMYDVYINHTLWQSFDGYAATAAQRDIIVSTEVEGRKLQGQGPHLLEIRNHTEKNKNSTGTKVRFKQLTVTARTWTQQTIGYTYDKLSRLKEARYNPGVNTAAVDADLLRRYLYAFDRAGNRTQQSVAVNGGAPTVTNYIYNAANQLVSDGTNTLTYDNNGNLTSDGVKSYTWDRANRLLSMGGADYQYDGEGRRVQQTVSSVVTKYLLDIQPGLAVVLSETEGSNVIRNVFSPRGIHAQKDSSNNWQWIAQDGLGNVREVLDNSIGGLESRNYGPYGDAFGGTITDDLDYEAPNFGFTGELVDGSGLLDLRARRYNAGMGVFASLDPFEGVEDEPMSLNGYGYVHGNPVNWTDPSGELCFVPILGQIACGAAAIIYLLGSAAVVSTAVGVKTAGEIDFHGFYPFGLGNPYNVPYSSTTHIPNATAADIVAGSNNRSSLPSPEETAALLDYLNSLSGNQDSARRVALYCNSGFCTTDLNTFIQYLTSGQRHAAPYEFRLKGLDEKIGTLAEHLAKVLNKSVAGYPPSGPNPDNRATNGWCKTIRRVIEEIDNADYTGKQFSRDLEAAGVSIDVWKEIKTAVKAAAKKCEDTWGDFGGGTLATG